MTCKKEEKTYSPVKCYYCGRFIDDYDELAYLNVDLNGSVKKTVQRAVHYYCVPKIKKDMKVESKRVEISNWDKCYKLFAEWLDLEMIDKNSDTRKKNYYFVQRLLGLRVNKFTPKGKNTLGLRDGYEFDVIYTTMLFVTHRINEAKRTMIFSDLNHKTNLFMKILISEVDFIANRLAAKKKEEEKLERQIKSISQVANNYEEVEIDKSLLRQDQENDLISDILESKADMEQDDDLEDIF